MDIYQMISSYVHKEQAEGMTDLFSIMRALDRLGKAGNTKKPTILKMQTVLFNSFQNLLSRTEKGHPIHLSSPFEGCQTIEGGLWEAQNWPVENSDSFDAIIKLAWGHNTMNLPAHIHEGSSRVVVITKGKGFFHFSTTDFEDFNGQNISMLEITEGNIICFPGDYIHTFSTNESSSLEFLSYHNPYFGLDDPRQYTLTPFEWRPISYHHSAS